MRVTHVELISDFAPYPSQTIGECRPRPSPQTAKEVINVPLVLLEERGEVGVVNVR